MYDQIPLYNVEHFGGLYLAFEGIGGCGKSTQLALLQQRMQLEGMLPPVSVKEPGGSPHYGASIRQMLMDAGDHNLTDSAELLLFMADRCQLLERVVLPSLQAKQVVISDRSVLSSFAYQGVAKRYLAAVHAVADKFLPVWPDLYILLDLPADKACERRKLRNDRFTQTVEFYEKVRAGYLFLANQSELFGRTEFLTFDASLDKLDLHQLIWQRVRPVLERVPGYQCQPRN